MRFITRPDFYHDFFNVQMRNLEKLARLLQSEVIYILYNAGLDFFFEKMLKTRGRHINRIRQITDHKLLGDVVFDSFEYFLYSVIHPLVAEVKKEPPKIKGHAVFSLFKK